MKRLWMSAQHENKRYPISYFIEWAERKEVQIGWLDWAKEKGYLNDQAGKKELRADAKTTYLNIIGILLEVIDGEFPDVEKHPGITNEVELIEIISTCFGNSHGLSERTLQRKFPEAKRSLKDS